MKTKLLLTLAALVLVSTPTQAQPTAFTYQGFLTVQGAPANGTNDFEFRLFNAATLGAQQGATVTTGDIGVTNGLFTVTLDFGGAVFTGADRWLGIAVRPGASMGAYTILVPRQPITATPYAVHAGGATAAGITGALPSTALAGTYSGMVSFNNAANVFAGNGAGLTNLNANSLGGVAASNYWRIGGNAGVTTNRYIGTTDYQPMELRVNDSPAMRLQPAAQNWPNLIGGAANNYAHADNTGVAIGGGAGNGVAGTSGGSHIGGGQGNVMHTNSAGSVIGGGTGNLLGDGSVRSVISGGWSNRIGGATGNDPRNIARDITDGTSNTILVGETFPGNAFIGGGWANRIGLDCPNGVITGGRFNSIADGTSNTILFSETEPGGGFIGGGRGNIIQSNSPCDVIVGGGANFLLGDGSVRFIGGGVDNVTDGCSHTFLGGGGLNRIGGSGDYAFLGGGWRNTNQTQFGVIVGGLNNRIGGEVIGDFFAGGGANFSGSPGSQWGDAIVGGSSNIIFGDGSVRFIASGINNLIDGTSNTILVGGGENRVQSPADYAFLGGGWRNTNAGAYSVITGGGNNRTESDHTTVGGGLFNTAGGTRSTVAGGQNNDASGGHAFIGGGQDNVASSSHAVAVGGSGNNATATFATVAGGEFNTAFGTRSFVGGGAGNQATGARSTVAGGELNQATGGFATIPGGTSNSAGQQAFAAGSNAKAVNTGAFVWADATGADLSSTADNSATFRASGGYRLFSNAGATAGVSLAAGDTSWAVISDRNAKKDFAPVDSSGVLEKLAALPIARWHYRWEDSSATPHIGPMAQDFKAAFYPGRDDTSITTLEADGVALAAIQGLNEKVETRSQESGVRMQELTEKLNRRDAEVAELKRELAEIKKFLKTLAR